jgi:hypothetical protein
MSTSLISMHGSGAPTWPMVGSSGRVMLIVQLVSV